MDSFLCLTMLVMLALFALAFDLGVKWQKLEYKWKHTPEDDEIICPYCYGKGLYPKPKKNEASTNTIRLDM